MNKNNEAFVRTNITVDTSNMVRLHLNVMTLVDVLKNVRRKNNVALNKKLKREPKINTIATQMLVMDMHRMARLPINQLFYNVNDQDINLLLWDINTFMKCNDGNTAKLFMEKLNQEDDDHRQNPIMFL